MYNFLTTGFELVSTGLGSNRSANCGKSTTYSIHNILPNAIISNHTAEIKWPLVNTKGYSDSCMSSRH